MCKDIVSNKIEEIGRKVLSGEYIEREEAVFLFETDDEYIEDILKISRDIKDKYMGKRMSLCSIMSGTVGACSEDCKFCAQSAHYKTDIEKRGLPSFEEVKKRADECEKNGIKRFSIVSSGRGADRDQLETVREYYRRLSEENSINLCASFGIISEEEMKKLRDSGVSMYHHNIETGREYYKNICTTHDFSDRINTIENAKKAGLKVCSGGIIGLGESIYDRTDFIMELRELKVDSIPVNVLDAIKGTPLENSEPLSENEILKTLAIFRIAYPEAEIRYAGGRKHLGDSQRKGVETSVSGMLSGNFLTTVGNGIEEDLKMVKDYKLV